MKNVKIGNETQKKKQKMVDFILLSIYKPIINKNKDMNAL